MIELRIALKNQESVIARKLHQVRIAEQITEPERRQPALQELLRAAPIARGTVAQVWNRGNAARAMAKRWVRERRVAAEVIRLLE